MKKIKKFKLLGLVIGFIINNNNISHVSACPNNYSLITDESNSN